MPPSTWRWSSSDGNAPRERPPRSRSPAGRRAHRHRRGPRGDDVAALVVDALHAQRASLSDGDVIAVSSKVVSKAAGLSAAAVDRDEVVLRESRRLVAARRTPTGVARIVESAAGPVMAAAGVDASNVEGDVVLTLPHDPDAAARELRTRLHELTGAVVGVVVTDTAGRPWRAGQTDFALGAAGIDAVEDLRGSLDTSGRELSVTARAVVDELAAAADLVKGKAEGVPAALFRGLADLVLPLDDPGPGARSLVRSGRATGSASATSRPCGPRSGPAASNPRPSCPEPSPNGSTGPPRSPSPPVP